MIYRGNSAVIYFMSFGFLEFHNYTDFFYDFLQAQKRDCLFTQTALQKAD